MVYNMLLLCSRAKDRTGEAREDSGFLVLLYRVSQKPKFLFPLSGNRNVLVRCIEVSSFPLSPSAVSKH